MASTRTVEVGPDGAVRLPRDVQEHLGLSAGSHMTVDLLGDGGVRLRPVYEEPEVVEKDGILVVRSVVVGDLPSVERAEREARLAALSQMGML